jgi:hypothetical protein
MHRAIPTHIANKAGFTNKKAKAGEVRLPLLRGLCSWFLTGEFEFLESE